MEAVKGGNHSHNLFRPLRGSFPRGEKSGSARALRSMAEPSGLSNSPEGEFFEAVAKLSGRNYDPQRVFVPFGLFRRDLTVANAGQAGYLVSTETQEASTFFGRSA